MIQTASLAWLEDVLENKFGARPVVKNAGPIEEASHGFTARIRRVGLDWKTTTSNKDLPKTVVIKEPAMGMVLDAFAACSGENAEDDKENNMAKRMQMFQAMVHKTEASMYGLFEKEKSPLPMPQCYASFDVGTEHPAIVMEDITEATVYDVVDGFNENQILSIIDAIVDLHLFSFTNDKWRAVEFMMSDDEDAGFGAIFTNFLTNLVKTNPDAADKWGRVLSHVSNPEFFNKYTKDCASNPHGVLVHGDMWSPQFLWRGDSLAAIVDWQISHPGSPAEDYLRLSTLCMPAGERKRLNSRFLKYYHAKLTERFADKGVPTPFSFEAFMEEYKQALPYTVMMDTFALCMWSNSSVLNTGSEDDEKRKGAIFERVFAVVEECLEAHGW